MALEDFSTDREHPIGEVKSRKKLDNLTIDRQNWVTLIGITEGEFPANIAQGMTDEELKAVIKLYDQQIQDDEYFGWEEDSEVAESVEETRENLVDILKGRKD